VRWPQNHLFFASIPLSFCGCVVRWSALRQRYALSHLPFSITITIRAEDWNLASPLQTCQLIVERRGDALVLEFSVSGALFCQSEIDLSSPPGSTPDAPKLSMEQMVEGAVDTSRYFVTRIQGPTKEGGMKKGHAASALIGFGFRERDTAVDFRESLQFYQRAMQREQQADQSSQHLSEYTIPKLGEDEKIHVNFGGAGGKKKLSTTITKAPASGSSGPSPGTSGSSAPLLLKKPPPPSDQGPAIDSAVGSAQIESTEQLSASLASATLDKADARNSTSDGGDTEKIDNNDDDWDEFQSAA
jgi:adaptin ear-binding coat-associated protein 1/2